MSLENHRRDPGMARMQRMACSFFVFEAVLMKIQIEDVWHALRLQIGLRILAYF